MEQELSQELSKGLGTARRGVAAAAVAVLVSACSSLPSPTAWIEDGRLDSAEQGEFRSLATVPEHPEQTGATAKQRRQQADERSDRAKSLVSDRDLIRHTREILSDDEPPPLVTDEPDHSSDASGVTTTARGLASSDRPYVGDGDNNSEDNQDRSPNTAMVSSAPVLTAKVAALDEGRLHDAIYLSKLKASALSQQAAVHPETAQFAWSSAPPLPARALKLATMFSALTDTNENLRNSVAPAGTNWPAGRLVRTSTGYEQGSPIGAAVGPQDRSRDVLLARANERGVIRAQDGLAPNADGNRPNAEPAHVIAQARPDMADDTGLRPVSALEIPGMVRQQQ